jgi:hypothetical protein
MCMVVGGDGVCPTAFYYLHLYLYLYLSDPGHEDVVIFQAG